MTATDIETRTPLAPVAPKDRIFTLDVLRGWAILGILAVNALMFAWPFSLEMATEIPPPWPHDPANILGHWVEAVFFQDKFRSLFSMLFGVSIFLIGGERGDEARSGLLLRRLLFLGLFGLIHGLAFWFGDILLHYAYCGLIVMLMRSWSARRLIWIGLSINLVAGLFAAAAMMAQALFAGAGADGGGGNPMAVTADQLAATIELYRSGFPAAHIENAKAWLFLQVFSIGLLPITMGLMMLGMGLFKAGFLAGRSPTWVYLLVFALGAGNLAFLGWFEWMDANAPHGAPAPSGGLAGVGASFAWVITLGYASMLILMTRFGLRFLTARLAPVGRMAFTNYLTQTLIMTSLFYMPWGPHWFGDPQWGPGGLWMIVGAIWIAQLIWSPLWLSVFQMGPLEWLWRCLTYGRMVPLRK
ncbi:DUF418 domain-containing protein [Brevundimonas sp. Root1279]|uniref:DUF418 domain-containing protein n=1 Tax=Brevundimonas sp. Root1279 TaxID=1736443 RepID=UPI0006FD2810|nr:DUF418 domain-containing protein [Brevundimonas sp. Root1279]KQW81862.1 hypothetical protein ASC65_11280 [Brevundimonas sp. Root1279]